MKKLYYADKDRYSNGMLYERCGRSGVMLPKVSLGFWHNFGSVDPYERSRELTHYAFDHGITHFDLANNYGPEYGSAEETMGRLMDEDFRPYRDELFISTKAGYDMWPGPYGNWGSRKYLMASLDQSLKRMRIDYVDLFYSHRYDPETPLEETLQALVDIVRAGKALYVGISNWPLEATRFAATRRAPADLSGQTEHARPQTAGGGHPGLLCRGGHRIYLVLAIGPGTAHRQVSQRHSAGLTHVEGQVPEGRDADA